MSGLRALSGPSPFGGCSIADKRGWGSYATLKKETDVGKKLRHKRSTADEAKVSNKNMTSVQINSKFAQDKTFMAVCTKFSLKPTRRQYSKFRAGRGEAFARLRDL